MSLGKKGRLIKKIIKTKRKKATRRNDKQKIEILVNNNKIEEIDDLK